MSETNPQHMNEQLTKPIYIVDGLRTPLLKAKGVPGPFAASDMAVAAGRSLLLRQPFAPHDIDELVLGCMMPSEKEANIGRLVGLRLQCGKDTPGFTVQRNCASGMQAIDSAFKDILLGRADLVLAGGTETMSRAPLILNEKMVRWLARWNKSRDFVSKVSTAAQFKPAFLAPIIALLHGLTDPLVGLNMGQTAEILAYRYGISRLEMDQFALESHQKALAAQQAGYFADEVIPLFDGRGHYYIEDTGVRSDTSLQALQNLKPFFDRKFGTVTAGNSSQVSDGAAMLILASEKAVNQYKLPVLGGIVDMQWAALAPEVMGLGPVMAATPILQRHQLTFADIDYWEINEAFAAQVLACVKAWQDKEFCSTNLHLAEPMGKLDQAKLNVDGGAVALGHPVGASGARIILHLLNVLQRNKAKRGMAAICIGGGQGGAMLLERM